MGYSIYRYQSNFDYVPFLGFKNFFFFKVSRFHVLSFVGLKRERLTLGC